MGFCHQKDLFRIESKPAFICQFQATRKESFVLYFMKTHHPALVQSIAKILHKKKKRWGVRSGTRVGINYWGVHI